MGLTETKSETFKIAGSDFNTRTISLCDGNADRVPIHSAFIFRRLQTVAVESLVASP